MNPFSVVNMHGEKHHLEAVKRVGWLQATIDEARAEGFDVRVIVGHRYDGTQYLSVETVSQHTVDRIDAISARREL